MPSLDLLLTALRREDLLASAPDHRPEVHAISTDSRGVRPGALYVAVRGSQADGHQFVPDAVRRGAAMVAVERATGSGVPEIIVRDGRRAALALARAWYGDPAAEMTLLGVTGTNGKTTTTGLLRHLLNADGGAGSIGTLGAFDGSGAAVASTAGSLTTPGPVDLQATLRALADRGVRRVVMETSSHSLDQGRLDGLVFAVGVFTNLTRDHLDYHATMEQYLAAKLRLLDLLAADGVAVVNADDRAWTAVPRATPRITFGRAHPADVAAHDVHEHAGGSDFRLVTPQGEAAVALPVPGDFNVANALAATAAALAAGTPFATVTDRLGSAPQVPGRMERIATRPCIIVRDYAHTPDALERALRTLRPLTPGRLLVVFGCGGDRDRGKRPLMGRIAAEHADLALVTSDNPRTEDPDAIIDDIVAGMGGTAHERHADRRAAIERAVALAGGTDTILLAGKGHEDYQVIGTEKLPFDERMIVREAGAA